MSELYYHTLRERFSPKPAPKCSVCGEEMSMQRISGSHVVYACSGMEDDGCFKTGRTYADEHYKKSRITVVDDSDPDVIELLDENMEMALTLEKLRVELEEAKSKLNEQREYYEGVISDGSKRIAELEKSEEQLINERDHAEAALADMYFAATGDRPEWSNWFGFSDAVDAVVDRIADLEAKQPSPVVPEEKPMPNPLSMYAVDAVAAIAEVRGWNACRAAMLQSQGNCIKDGWISCSERMPVIGELNWRTSFPLLITCEIGVIPAYYGFVSVNGDRHYGFMESLKYGDDSGNHPQTNEYGLISNVTHWMPLPEPQQEVK
ncbi:TPA: ead/Ea22-like family protein [Escherichia coli]|nr:ead/Ea22-like family protein [Escherichia coli]